MKTHQIHSFFKEINKNKYVYLLALPGIIFFFIFSYLPMIGIVIAFQDYNPIKGIFGSKFVGLRNFEFFFTSLELREANEKAKKLGLEKIREEAKRQVEEFLKNKQ